MHKSAFSFSFLLSAILTPCSSSLMPSLLTAISLPLVASDEAAHQCNTLGFDLDPFILSSQENGIFSPFSIYYCLSMACYGAHGATREQMEKRLYHPLSREEMAKANQKLAQELFTKRDESDCSLRLESANALFVSQDIALEETFTSGLNNYYGAGIQPLNFKDPQTAAPLINAWISDATHEKIPSLLTPSDIDPCTQLMLANAIYFKGEWSHPFSRSATKRGLFHVSEKLKVDAAMMAQLASFAYFENESWQVTLIPFKSSSSGAAPALIIALPKVTTNSGYSLGKLKESLRPEDLLLWQQQSLPTRLELELPSFCLRQRLDLSEALIASGVDKPFSSSADFSDISSSMHLEFDKVLHEAYFDLNEDGVEAAAVTTLGIKVTSCLIEKDPVPFIADHPFLFFLIDQKTQALLFQGQLLNPLL